MFFLLVGPPTSCLWNITIQLVAKYWSVPATYSMCLMTLLHADTNSGLLASSATCVCTAILVTTPVCCKGVCASSAPNVGSWWPAHGSQRLTIFTPPAKDKGGKSKVGVNRAAGLGLIAGPTDEVGQCSEQKVALRRNSGLGRTGTALA